jgi:hypothetical protein
LVALFPAPGRAGRSFCIDRTYATAGFSQNPSDYQINQHLKQLSSSDAQTRAAAIEVLSFLRSYESAGQVVDLLQVRTPRFAGKRR